MEMRLTDRKGIELDYCPQCRGIWLDRGELDKIIERSAGIINAPHADDPHDDYDRYANVKKKKRGHHYDDDNDDYHHKKHSKKHKKHDKDYRKKRKKRENPLTEFFEEIFDF